MPRARTGCLVYKKSSGWNARVWVDVKDPTGEIGEERRWVPLETHDRDLAKRKMKKIVAMLASGELVADAARAEAKREWTVAEHDEIVNAHRRATGVRSVEDEEIVQRRHVHPHIGAMTLKAVRPANVRGVLLAAIAAGLRRNTVRTIRAVMFRSFRAAWESELIPENPVAKVRVPKMSETKRARVILADEEIAQYIADPRAKRAELKLLSLAARTEGGMRTGDLMRWDWTMIDRVAFELCVIPRAKKGQPQTLEIPEVLRPFLRAWWVQRGCPASGPVFPRVRGEAKGKARAARGVSFAAALRRELLRAGVVRHECDGSCSREKDPTPCANFATDSLYNDTPSSQRVDFHSFRRAFNTALAEAGVNVQQAMHLAGHSDPKVHAMYVMSTRRMQRIPAAALPQIPMLVSATAVTNPSAGSHEVSGNSRRGWDSNPRMSVLQGDTGTVQDASLRALAPWSWVPAALAAHRRLPLRIGEKARGCASSFGGRNRGSLSTGAIMHHGEPLVWS